MQEKRRRPATLGLIRHGSLKRRLTLWFYCGKRAPRRHRIRWRAAQITMFCWDARCCAPQHCYALNLLLAGRPGDQPSKPVAAPGIPVVSDTRLAGDAKQTRFILDLDKTISFRAFPLADPYRVVVDIPQVNFQLPAGVGTSGRGLVKAFRYGLVMPGGSRIVFDLNGPAKIANSYVLEAANGQPPRLVLELEEVDRATFVQSLSSDNRPELRPAIGTAKDALATTVATIEARRRLRPSRRQHQTGRRPRWTNPRRTPDKRDAAADLRPVIVIDPGHGGDRQRHAVRQRIMKRPWCWDLGWRCVTGSRKAGNIALS